MLGWRRTAASEEHDDGDDAGSTYLSLIELLQPCSSAPLRVQYPQPQIRRGGAGKERGSGGAAQAYVAVYVLTVLGSARRFR